MALTHNISIVQLVCDLLILVTLFPARRQEGGISTAAAIRNLEAEELVVELEVNGQDGRFIEEVFTAPIRRTSWGWCVARPRESLPEWRWSWMPPDYEITVRVSDGANRAEADFTVRLQDVDDIAPIFSEAVANGSTLTLAYSEALDSSSVPGTDAFTVTGGNQTRTVTGVVVNGSAVELTLDPAVEHGQTGIRVSYTVPTGTGATPIQDTAGNDADSFNNRQVSNNRGDTTGPAVETVSITSSAGSDATYAAGETIQATVTFDETVVVTGRPRLTLKVGRRDRTADYQSVTGGAVRFEYQVVAGDSDPDGVAPVLVDPDGAVVNGATLTLTYGLGHTATFFICPSP